MPQLNLKFLKHIDWGLFVAVTFLALFGLSAIYGIALGRGDSDFGNFQKQLLWLLLGLPAMLAVAFVDYRLWRKIGWIGYFISLLLLVLVLTPLGRVINGARGWFYLGLFSFQPVELMKIFLILVLADIAGRYSRTVYQFRHLFFMGAVVAVPLALVMVQPDFGSAMVMFVIWLIAFVLIVKNKWQAITIFGMIIAIGAIAWLFILQGYQKDRIYTFINPASDPQGRGYNVHQSMIAIGAGQLFGRGLGFGSQSQLKFIPESQTDFIFAVIAEEIGFVGVVLVLGLYALFFYRLYRITINATDDFGMFLALFTAGLTAFHVLINVGMCIGLLPVTGISLPFVSYGGSFLLTMMVLIGINMSVCRYGLLLKQRQSVFMIG